MASRRHDEHEIIDLVSPRQKVPAQKKKKKKERKRRSSGQRAVSKPKRRVSARKRASRATQQRFKEYARKRKTNLQSLDDEEKGKLFSKFSREEEQKRNADIATRMRKTLQNRMFGPRPRCLVCNHSLSYTTAAQIMGNRNVRDNKQDYNVVACSCGHRFHYHCLKKFQAIRSHPYCPKCNAICRADEASVELE